MNSDLSNSELLDETLSEKYSNITDNEKELITQGSQAFNMIINQAGNVLASSQYNRSSDGCLRPLFTENFTNRANWNANRKCLEATKAKAQASATTPENIPAPSTPTKKSGSNTLLIVGVSAFAVLALGLTAYFVFIKK